MRIPQGYPHPPGALRVGLRTTPAHSLHRIEILFHRIFAIGIIKPRRRYNCPRLRFIMMDTVSCQRALAWAVIPVAEPVEQIDDLCQAALDQVVGRRAVGELPDQIPMKIMD